MSSASVLNDNTTEEGAQGASRQAGGHARGLGTRHAFTEAARAIDEGMLRHVFSLSDPFAGLGLSTGPVRSQPAAQSQEPEATPVEIQPTRDILQELRETAARRGQLRDEDALSSEASLACAPATSSSPSASSPTASSPTVASTRATSPADGSSALSSELASPLIGERTARTELAPYVVSHTQERYRPTAFLYQHLLPYARHSVVDPYDALGTRCPICQERYTGQDWVRRHHCGHFAHR
jgi:hypothetical protein